MPELTPELLLRAYASGIFPMSEHRDDPEIFWVEPTRRGVLPLDGFHISRSLAKTLRAEPFRVTLDQAFADVVDGCADRAETWINDEIRTLYDGLHDIGHAHSLELWRGDLLVGGVYGVSLGAAFFGESMFSRERDASKVALAYLITHLGTCGFRLFDTQFLTEHLATLGAVEITREDYLERLDVALQQTASVHSSPLPDVAAVLQRRTQIS